MIVGENKNQERPIGVQYDNRGNPYWQSTTSPPDESRGVCYMVPDRVIPVIFVPGVMGSNLIGSSKGNLGQKWLLDSEKTMLAWLGRGPESRKRILSPNGMTVYGDGKTGQGTSLPAEEIKRRYWGEIGHMSYGEALVWLENALNDFDNHGNGVRKALMAMDLRAERGEKPPTRDEVALSYRYRFPVHACGYNWLASNHESAKRLGKRIDEIIGRYRKEKKKIEKVIVVTHSMGGLVARCCSEVLGYQGKILGVVHGVMPAIGAAAVYRRFKAGTENPGGSVKKWAAGKAASEILGGDGAEMTAVLSSAPGPLQLLPTPEYGNGWLQIEDGDRKHALPTSGDPYEEIYTARGKWWSMCEDHLMNPLNKEYDPVKRKAQMDRDWMDFDDLINKQVIPFHADIANKYHPATHAFYGSGEDRSSFGNVIWKGDGGGWWRGKRKADVLGARPLDSGQIEDERTVAAPLSREGWLKGERQTYTLAGPDEQGDGTVPLRSGVAPRQRCHSFLRVEVGHEPAYKPSEGPDNLRACQFTVRAIVQIAQAIQNTALRYE